MKTKASVELPDALLAQVTSEGASAPSKHVSLRSGCRRDKAGGVPLSRAQSPLHPSLGPLRRHTEESGQLAEKGRGPSSEGQRWNEEREGFFWFLAFVFKANAILERGQRVA